MNHRPVVNRSLQYGFEDGYRSLVTIGRHPVGVILLETNPRYVDVNIHPAKREIRFRDERVARDACGILCGGAWRRTRSPLRRHRAPRPSSVRWPSLRRRARSSRLSRRRGRSPRNRLPRFARPRPWRPRRRTLRLRPNPLPRRRCRPGKRGPSANPQPRLPRRPRHPRGCNAGFGVRACGQTPPQLTARQSEFPEMGRGDEPESVAPEAVYRPVNALPDAPLQLFDTYLLVPGEDRLLIIDQHALHERLNYDSLLAELADHTYEAQQLIVPIVIEVAPAQVRLLESNLKLFHGSGLTWSRLSGNTFQVTAICHLLRRREGARSGLPGARRAGPGRSVRRPARGERGASAGNGRARRRCAGRSAHAAERSSLLEGVPRLRPPYTCPHGRPILSSS